MMDANKDHKGKFVTKFRCEETIELEDFLMSKSENEFTKIKAEVTYSSGRIETVHGKLNKNNMPDNAFQKTISKMRNLPTVKDIKIIKIK